MVKGSSAYQNAIYWVHPLVALDYIGTVRVELKTQLLIWLFLLLNRGSVSLADRRDVAAFQDQLNSAVAELQTACIIRTKRTFTNKFNIIPLDTS